MFDLDGIWLLGALVAVYFTGVFTGPWAKDKIMGVPSELRKALTALESSAKNELVIAKAKVVADTATLLSAAKAKVTADLSPQPSAAPALTTLDAKPVVVTPVAPITPVAPLTPLG